MKYFNHIFICFLCIIITNNVWASRSDSIKVATIISKIESLENNSIQRAEYISQIDHLYIESYAPNLYTYIKVEYDNISNIKSKYIQFDICHLMEAVYYAFSEYELGAPIAYQLLDIARETKDSLHYYFAYSSISGNESAMGNNDNDIEFLLLAHSYASFNQSILAKSNIELGDYFLGQEKYQIAGEYLQKALNIAKKNNDLVQLPYAYNLLMDLYYELENYDEALLYYDKVDSLYKTTQPMNSSRDLLEVTFLSALIYIAKNDFDIAEHFLENTLKMAKASNSRYMITNVYEEWSRLEELKGDYKKSLEFYKQFTGVKDSIIDVESLNKLNKLKVLYDIETKDLEIKVSQQKEKYAKRQMWLITISSLIFIAALTVLAFLLRMKLKASRLRERLNKEKSKNNQYEIEKLEREVQLKNKELADLFLHQFEKATIINEVIESVDVSSIKLKQAIHQQQNKEKDWINFKAHFDNVHEGFFDKLNALSNELTPKDIRFCAYIRMNLSSKEIAIMLGISHRTVQGIRGRVRKKINLDSNEDLILFLMNL